MFSRDGEPNLLTSSQTVATSDNITWTLGNLSLLSDAPGDYELLLNAVGSGITDIAGNALLTSLAETFKVVRLGDMDGDGDTDNFDILSFELALTDQADYLSRFPACSDYAVRGDANRDGVFDNFDIQPFELLLTSGAPSAPLVPLEDDSSPLTADDGPSQAESIAAALAFALEEEQAGDVSLSVPAQLRDVAGQTREDRQRQSAAPALALAMVQEEAWSPSVLQADYELESAESDPFGPLFDEF